MQNGGAGGRRERGRGRDGRGGAAEVAAAAAAATACLLAAKCFRLLSPLFAAGTVVRHRRFPLNSSKTLKRNILSDVYTDRRRIYLGALRGSPGGMAAVVCERGSRRKAASAKYCINKCAGEIFMAVPNYPSTVPHRSSSPAARLSALSSTVDHRRPSRSLLRPFPRSLYTSINLTRIYSRVVSI